MSSGVRPVLAVSGVAPVATEVPAQYSVSLNSIISIQIHNVMVHESKSHSSDMCHQSSVVVVVDYYCNK